MHLPKKPAPGQPVEARTIRELIDWCRASRLMGVIGGKMKQSPNGTTVEIPKRKTKPQIIPAHPWKVTANGDDTVGAGYGSIYSYDQTSLTLREFKYYSGPDDPAYTPVTVTGAGSLYGRIAAALATAADINFSGTDSNGDTFAVNLLRIFPDVTANVLFSFETTVPTSSSVLYFEIAKVDLVDGVAVVTRQILTHNPTLSSWIEPT